MSETAVETHGFQTEVKQLLHLMVHSLYSNKEIFLRELVSNASDAIDKLRFEALDNPALYESEPNLEIRVSFDEKENTLTISDNGVGMTREEVMANLGTIAKSGTADFIKSLSGDQAKDAQLIGQFGVGFYSSFIVASTVEVITRRAGHPTESAVRWVSEGDGEYQLSAAEKTSRGTTIVLHLREDAAEFLNGMRLRNIITRYSDHIATPILMPEMATPELEGDANESEAEVASEDKAAEWESVNSATALWTRAKGDISDEDYVEFYKHIAHDFEEPLQWGHNKVEGKYEYTSLLYLPKRAPFDLYNPNKPRGLKLFVQRVFIMDDAEQFMPTYLRFVKGIVDSNDLPLNVSREILQGNKTIDAMRGALTKRVLSMLEDMANNDAEKYATFWETFGNVLKEGPAEDFANRERVAKLLRFSSTYLDDAKQTIGLEAYKSRMKEGQNKIYYVAADSFAAAKNSPHLEIFRKKGIEVLLLSDKIDEWLLSHLTEFDGTTFQSVAQGDLEDLKTVESTDEDEKPTVDESLFAKMLEMAGTHLTDKVTKVRLSDRLTHSPACIVADQGQMTRQMERLLQQAGQQVNSKPILELNPEHPLVKRLNRLATDETAFNDLADVLLGQAILAEGAQLENPAEFVAKLNQLLITL